MFWEFLTRFTGRKLPDTLMRGHRQVVHLINPVGMIRAGEIKQMSHGCMEIQERRTNWPKITKPDIALPEAIVNCRSRLKRRARSSKVGENGRRDRY